MVSSEKLASLFVFACGFSWDIVAAPHKSPTILNPWCERFCVIQDYKIEPTPNVFRGLYWSAFVMRLSNELDVLDLFNCVGVQDLRSIH